MMSAHARMPSWWHTLPGACHARLLELLAEIDKLGVSRNDRITVERVWREQQIARAMAKLQRNPRSEPPETA